MRMIGRYIYIYMAVGASYSGSIVKSGINWAYDPIRGCWPIRGGPNETMSRTELREE